MIHVFLSPLSDTDVNVMAVVVAVVVPAAAAASTTTYYSVLVYGSTK
jgi:hypothetical protein